MVTLPPNFTATKFPGYFWNIEERCVYSIKSGTLKRLKKETPNHFNEYKEGWRVSVNGRRRWLPNYYLLKLKPTDSVIEVRK